MLPTQEHHHHHRQRAPRTPALAPSSFLNLTSSMRHTSRDPKTPFRSYSPHIPSQLPLTQKLTSHWPQFKIL